MRPILLIRLLNAEEDMFIDNIVNDMRTKIAALSHENYQLRKLLDKEREKKSLSKYDPFENPTEYPGYSGDYSEIVPQVEAPGCEFPLNPAKSERQGLRRLYSVGGTCMLLHFIATSVLSLMLVQLIMLVLSFINPDIGSGDIYNYAYSSSILMAVNALVYLTTNTVFAFLGLRWAKIPPSSLLKTRDLKFGHIVQYCTAALALQYIAAFFSGAVSDIIEKYGYSIDVMDTDTFAITGMGTAVTVIYTCIVAPITEELFFRGMMLKVFSRANQRFAIIISSIFFGLNHGNIPQFALAFLLGVFLAHIDMKHNSLLPSIFVHMFVNTVSTVITQLDDKSSVFLMSAVNVTYMVLLIVGVIMLIEFMIKNKLPSATPHQSRRGFAIAKTSVTVVLAFAALLIYMILLIFQNKN